MLFGVSSSVTECFQSVTYYLQPVTELGTPKNMAVALPGMTLQPLYTLYHAATLGCVTGYQVIRVIRIFAKTYPFEYQLSITRKNRLVNIIYSK